MTRVYVQFVETAGAVSEVFVRDSNNVSGGYYTAATALGGGVGIGGIAAGTQTATNGTVVFSNSNGVTFGMSGSSRITASHNGLTNINVSAGTTSNNLSAVTFSNTPTVSFGLAGSVVTASAVGGGAGGPTALDWMRW